MMIIWAHPEWLNALWAIPVLGLVWLLHEMWRGSVLRKFGHPELRRNMIRLSSGWRRVLREALALAALGAVILALANPQEEKKEIEVERRGLDMVFAIDLSRSMLTEDVAPSRLELSKQIIRNIINRSAGDRVGILAFSGGAYVQMPVSPDVAAAELTLSNLDPKYIPSAGSDVRSALDVGLKMFQYDAPQDKALIIISDGEDHEGEWRDRISNAVDSGIFVFTIGVGTAAGAPIPGRYPGEYHKDSRGEVVISKRDETTLREMAREGRGRYFDGNRLDVAKELMEDMRQLQRAEFGMTRMADMEDRFQLPLGLGLLFLFIRTLLSERSSDALKKWLKNA